MVVINAAVLNVAVEKFSRRHKTPLLARDPSRCPLLSTPDRPMQNRKQKPQALPLAATRLGPSRRSVCTPLVLADGFQARLGLRGTRYVRAKNLK